MEILYNPVWGFHMKNNSLTIPIFVQRLVAYSRPASDINKLHALSLGTYSSLNSALLNHSGNVPCRFRLPHLMLSSPPEVEDVFPFAFITRQRLGLLRHHPRQILRLCKTRTFRPITA